MGQSFKSNPMKSVFFLLSGCILLALPGCKVDVELDWPEHQPQLVVNAMIVADSTFFVYVSRTVSKGIILPREDRVVTDALVELWENGIVLDTLQYRDSVIIRVEQLFPSTDTLHQRIPFRAYVSNRYVAEAGHSYTLRAFHPGYGLAEATERVPMPPPLVGAFVEGEILIDDNGRPVSQLTLELDDPAGQRNYYHLPNLDDFYWTFGGLAHFVDPGWGSQPVFAPFQILGISRPNFQAGLETQFEDAFDNGIISDDLFDGQQARVSIYCRLPFVASNPGVIPQDYVLSFRAYSESYYLYEQTLKQHFQNKSDDLGLFRGEPIEMYSNVKGGYGIVAACAMRKDTFDF